MADTNATPATPATPAAGQPAQQEVRVRLDERNLHAGYYTNGFRTSATPEEVILDFGLNLINPVTQQGGQPEFVFQAGERIIMNYFTAKRLALTLGQMVRRHEEQFGDLELDANKRRK